MKLDLHHVVDGTATRAAYAIRPLGTLPKSSIGGTPTTTTTATTTTKRVVSVPSLLQQNQQQRRQHHHTTYYTDMNDMAETILEELVVPSNMILFGGACPCIVENLP
jgi:hypothetical protein